MPRHAACDKRSARNVRAMTKFAVVLAAGWDTGAGNAGMRARASSDQRYWTINVTDIRVGVRALARA